MGKGVSTLVKRHFFKVSATLLVLVGVGVAAGLNAQLFNLDDEDVTPVKDNPAQNAGAGRAPLKVPAHELSEDSEEDKVAMEKVYQEVLTAFKENKVKEGSELLTKYDVITRQKILYRLRQETFNVEREPNAVDDEAVNSAIEAVPETPSTVEEAPEN